ncbi:hypothetical protein ACFJIY_10180 [Pimelobacter simplex]|uniref:hypothetical protein n=1 Tax=Nocardioides simplex TaxID=2045 RepID=UPI00366F60FA
MSRSARLVLAVLLSALLVAPAAAAHAAPAPSPDAEPAARAVPVKAGKYVGRIISAGSAQEKLTLTVKNRKLTKFRVNLAVYCWNYDHYEVQVHPVAFPSTKINAKGKVNRTWKPNSSSTITLRATFKKGKAKAGYLKYNVASCSREAGWTARRG